MKIKLRFPSLAFMVVLFGGMFYGVPYFCLEPNFAAAPKLSKGPHKAPAQKFTRNTELDLAKAHLLKVVQAGKLSDAENLARRYQRNFPQDAFFNNELSKIYAAQGDYFWRNHNLVMASQKARAALTIDLHNKHAKDILAQIMAKQGLVYANADDHQRLGDNLIKQNNFMESEVEYRLAQTIKPGAASYVGLGNIAFQKRLYANARLQYEKALEKEPASGLAHRQRGLLKYATGDLAGANSDLCRAVSLSPEDKFARAALVELWQHQVNNNPQSVNGHLGLARAYLQCKNLEAARAEYKEVVRLDPQNPNLPAARYCFKLAAHHLKPPVAPQIKIAPPIPPNPNELRAPPAKRLLSPQANTDKTQQNNLSLATAEWCDHNLWTSANQDHIERLSNLADTLRGLDLLQQSGSSLPMPSNNPNRF